MLSSCRPDLLAQFSVRIFRKELVPANVDSARRERHTLPFDSRAELLYRFYHCHSGRSKLLWIFHAFLCTIIYFYRTFTHYCSILETAETRK